MFQRLIKHTDEEHPDQKPLQEALKLVHDILLHLNCKEREALENDQREATLRELEVSISIVIGIELPIFITLLMPSSSFSFSHHLHVHLL